MAGYIKLNDQYTPIEYLAKPADSFWEFRETIEITVSGEFSEIRDFFKTGNWRIYNEFYGSTAEPSMEEEQEVHMEKTYRMTDMSEYCICGFVKDNMDGTITVKMSKMNALEKFIESMLGGL